jgi:hypothetical protein
VSMLKLFIIIDEKQLVIYVLVMAVFLVFDNLMLLFEVQAVIIAVIILLDVLASCCILKFSIF